jgi:hypothetical protein
MADVEDAFRSMCESAEYARQTASFSRCSQVPAGLRPEIEGQLELNPPSRLHASTVRSVVEGGAEQRGSLWRELSHFDAVAISIPTGLRCAVAIALPLIVGISSGHSRAAGWGAVGAFLTDMAMNQPEHRFRARVVAGAAFLVALGGFLGALSGIEGWVIYPLVAVWTAASGLAVAISPRAALVGVSSATGLLYAASFHVSTLQSAEVGAWMLAAGLGAAAIGWVTNQPLVARRASRPPAPAAPAGLEWVRSSARAIRRGLTVDSILAHHATRLTTVSVVATVLYRVINPIDGFWIPEAALFIGRPDATLSLERSILRVAGSFVGVTLTTLLLVTIEPTAVGLAVIAVVAGAIAFAVQRVNFGLYITFVTVIFVVLTAFGGVPESHAVYQRLLYNVLGATLAAASLRLWPSPARRLPAPST